MMVPPQISRMLLALSLFFFFILSYSEFTRSRKQLLAQINQPLPSITLSDFPSQAAVGQPLKIDWEILSQDNTSVSKTAIYYDYDSTPSAITTLDSPLAVGYSFQSHDYSQGVFAISSQFSISLIPPHSGTLYFRAYANLNGLHLWTQERSTNVK